MQRLVIYIVAVEMMIIFNSCVANCNYLGLQNKAYAYELSSNKEAMDYFFIGLDYQTKGQYEKAIEQFSLAIIRDSNYYLSYKFRGNAYINLGKKELAINDYNKAISLAPYNSDLYVRRGIAFEEIKKYYSAIKDYNKAIILDENNSYAYQQRAKLYAHLEKRREAIDDVNKALKLKNDCLANLSAGFVYDILHDYEKSVWHYEKALALAPQNRVTEIQKWLKNEKEQYEAAIEITNVRDESTFAYYSAALVNNSYGNYDKAYEYSLKALKLDAKYYAAH